MTLRTAIIGTGKVGHLHARALQTLGLSDFVAACGRRLGSAQTFAENYAIAAYTDIATMILEQRVDVVCICTPHPTHRDVALQAIAAGAHVIIEKPLAMSVAECDDILDAATAANRQVGTIVQRRYYAPCQRIAEAIKSGKIGIPVLGSATLLGWRDQKYYDSDAWRGTWEGEGGGVLVNQAPHQLDLLLWYMGEATEVYGVWRNFNHDYIEVDDTAVATVKFSSGGIASILVSNSQNPALYGKVHIHGSNGASVGVQTDGGGMFIAGMSSITQAPYNDLWTVPGEEEITTRVRQQDEETFFNVDPVDHFHALQIGRFLESVAHGTAVDIDGEAGRNTVALIEAIYESSRTGLPVPLSPRRSGEFNK
ncbi:Gfo/Idh/MocA family protein [Kushneria phyllosphaerae]|uniref:Glucose--fructose oxidoreductase n=1 Tax=Kushneria phyllosphaerae TaxID=2100822 RepID=A0A2R8CJ02_9GAMM|nr:Gfo/Idh/MocA family oxidoreductase [Kushneria phyllosphaerae]SPJ32865.1 Glucose--fructose oxidoreductase [Kushneria phyllosphaerae]